MTYPPQKADGLKSLRPYRRLRPRVKVCGVGNKEGQVLREQTETYSFPSRAPNIITYFAGTRWSPADR